MATRTSARRKGPNKKYTVDAFAGLEDILGEAAEESERDIRTRRILDGDDDEDDVDFNGEQAIAAELEDAQVDEHDSMEDVEENGEADSDANSAPAAEPSDVEDIVPRVQPAHRNRTPRNKESMSLNGSARDKVKWRRPYGIDPSTVPRMAAFDRRAYSAPAKVTSYVRGMPDFYHSMSKALHVLYVFGDASEDLQAFYEIKERFFEQVTLPSRRPVKQKGVLYGGLTVSPLHTAQRREKEAVEGWAWYRDQGKARFQDIQHVVMTRLGKEHFLQSGEQGSSCLLGPPQAPQVRKLGPGDILPLLEPWNLDSAQHSKSHQGWLLHAGGKVQCLSWVPNRSSRRQLLCIVTTPKSEQGVSEDPTSNAFVPRPGFRSSMNIWEFHTDSTETGARPDMKVSPKLRAVLSWDWGDLRKMEWCPVPGDYEDRDDNHLGLLAGIWRDGRMRVLDVQLPDDSNEADSVPSIHYYRAAFDVRPPDTVCSVLAWLSSSNIVAGHANGFVGIWSLPHSLQGSSNLHSQSSSSIRPFFYHKLHDTYILSLTSAYPSRPHILITQAVDGTTKSTSILDPIADYSGTQRSRVSVSAIAWFDWYQSLLSTDENGALNYTAIRRFFTKTVIHRLSALISDIAVSPLHPCSLSACADGTVWAVNPIRRARNLRCDAWAQIWFKHEWRRPVSELVLTESVYDDAKHSQQNPGATTVFHSEMTQLHKEPLIRITDGYKLTPSSQNSDMKGKRVEVPILSTVHEPLSLVNKVAWNPNLVAGTWAAAGMASGLVRIEDIGID